VRRNCGIAVPSQILPDRLGLPRVDRAAFRAGLDPDFHPDLYLARPFILIQIVTDNTRTVHYRTRYTGLFTLVMIVCFIIHRLFHLPARRAFAILCHRIPGALAGTICREERRPGGRLCTVLAALCLVAAVVIAARSCRRGGMPRRARPPARSPLILPARRGAAALAGRP
jgi:hypothetical protein